MVVTSLILMLYLIRAVELALKRNFYLHYATFALSMLWFFALSLLISVVWRNSPYQGHTCSAEEAGRSPFMASACFYAEMVNWFGKLSIGFAAINVV